MSNTESIKIQKKGLSAYFRSMRNEIENKIRHDAEIEKSYGLAPNIDSDFINLTVSKFNEKIISVNQINEHENLPKFKEYEKSSYPSNSYAILQNIKNDCEMIISLFSEDDNVVLDIDINNLNSLREEFGNLGILDLHIQKNIEYAIKLFEKGESFASAIVTSRIMDVVINQIAIPDEIKKQNDQKKKNKKSKVELKIEYLTKLGIINEKEKEMKLNLMKYLKLARNFLTHDLSFYPTNADALGILSNCIQIIDLRQKYDNIIE